MQWYYSADGQQQGPVSQSVLESLAQAGTITGETLVWHEGMADWATYSSVPGGWAGNRTPVAAAGTALSTGAQARCTECGRSFPMDDMVTYEGSHVCATCKPLFFQKVREGVVVGGARLWRSKKQLVASLNPVLPTRCVKCNAPTDSHQLKRNLQWHHPAVFLALLFNILIYLIIAMITRKRTTAMVSVCPEHRVARRNAIVVAWVLVLIGIGLLIFGASEDSGALAIGGVVVLVAGIIYGFARGRLVYATKIEPDHVRLGGCGKDFLAQFPEWTGH